MEIILITYSCVVYVVYSVISASASAVAVQSATFGVDRGLFVSSLLTSSLRAKYRVYSRVDSCVFCTSYWLSELFNSEHLNCVAHLSYHYIVHCFHMRF